MLASGFVRRGSNSTHEPLLPILMLVKNSHLFPVERFQLVLTTKLAVLLGLLDGIVKLVTLLTHRCNQLRRNRRGQAGWSLEAGSRSHEDNPEIVERRIK